MQCEFLVFFIFWFSDFRMHRKFAIRILVTDTTIRCVEVPIDKHLPENYDADCVCDVAATNSRPI